MNLIREHWTAQDGVDFQKYLLSYSQGEEKALWEQRITGTSLKCLAVSSKDIKEIVSKIAKGNFLEFINLWSFDNLTSAMITGQLICKIKDFEKTKDYLTVYSKKIDSWACTDTIKLKVKDTAGYISFAKELSKSNYIFARRLGVILMLKYINNNTIDEILNFLNKFENEKEYYVNMALSWLFCECFIKQREKTLMFLKSHKMSNFVVNKGISKCRDSFRVSDEDKKLLLKYKK